MPAGFLFDLEGTIYQGDTLLPGARAVLAQLAERGIPVGFVTNTTSRSRAMLVSRLATHGIRADADQVTTAPRAARRVALERGWQRVAPFLPEAAHEDLAPLSLEDSPDAIIVGDLGARWSFQVLQDAFEHIQRGAALIACTRDRYYRGADGLVLDAGPFVAALEHATGVTALLAGKPSAAIFDAAVAALGVPAARRHEIVMIGDDLSTDVGGAQGAGLTAWAVRTGKHAPDDVERLGIVPDRILTDLRELLADGPG